MICDLASLIAPQPKEVFRDHFLKKTRFHMKAADPDRAASLLPWPTINQIVESESLPAESLKVVRAGNVVHPSLYRTQGENPFLRSRALQDLLRQGSSLVLNGIDRAVPAIMALTSAIERELSCMVSCNAYLSFGAGSAFRAHYDLHDVIALQVHGRKRWQSFGIPVPHPIEQSSRSVADGRKAEWEDALGPGDVLYLPRGEIHVAELGDVNSVHLTIGLSPRRGLDFAEAIVKQAAEDAIFRQDIPSAGGEAALAEYEADLKKSLHALVDRTRLSDFLEGDSRRRLLRPLANLGAGGGPFNAETLVIPAVRRRIPLDVESEEAIDVAIARETFRLSAPARRVLDFLLTNNDSTFGAIVSAFAPRLSEPLAQDAVMELAKHGLVGVRA